MIADLEAVHVRQADVEDDDLGGLAAREVDALLAGGGVQHLGVGPAQGEGEGDDFDDIRLVVNDQNFHN